MISFFLIIHHYSSINISWEKARMLIVNGDPQHPFAKRYWGMENWTTNFRCLLQIQIKWKPASFQKRILHVLTYCHPSLLFDQHLSIEGADVDCKRRSSTSFYKEILRDGDRMISFFLIIHLYSSINISREKERMLIINGDPQHPFAKRYGGMGILWSLSSW